MPTVSSHTAVEHRTSQQMIALAFAADELPAQINDLRQIQVIPFRPAVIDALEARIETAPDMDDDCVRAAVQKIAAQSDRTPAGAG